MLITVEIPDSLAGQLHLSCKADLRSLLQALVKQRDVEGKLTAVQVGEALKLGGAATDELLSEYATSGMPTATGATRPRRDVMARLRGIYGDLPMTGENAVLAARSMERY